ncbi:hypothetical protein D3C86_1648430 [compost metagenome]
MARGGDERTIGRQAQARCALDGHADAVRIGAGRDCEELLHIAAMCSQGYADAGPSVAQVYAGKGGDVRLPLRGVGALKAVHPHGAGTKPRRSQWQRTIQLFHQGPTGPALRSGH